MPANPLIPLGVQTPDIGSQVQRFTALHNRQLEEDKRNEIFSEKVKAEREKFEAEAEAKKIEQAQKEYTADIVRVKGLIDAGLPDRAVELLDARANRLQAAGRDPSDTLKLLDLARTNPGEFQKELGVELGAARDLGLLKEQEDRSFTLAPGAKRFDAQGNEIASAPAKSDVKSPEAMAQSLELIRERARIEAANNPASRAVAELANLRAEGLRLANEEKRNAIDAKARAEAEKKVEAENKKVEQFTFLTETKEIVDRLLTPEGREAVAAAAGPVGSMVPTLRDATADAEIDIETIKSRLTKDNLGLLKGVISDSDIKFLGRIAAGGLDLSGSDQGVIRELGRIQGNIDAAIKSLEEDAQAERPTIDVDKPLEDMTDGELAELAKRLTK